MTIRGVGLGLLLGFFISIATYFNDWVIGQTNLIGNHLPISVFGIAAFLVFAINPPIWFIHRRLPLTAAEIAVITGLGLSACGWPGSNFYRGFATGTALPAHWLKTKADWQATQVMSYIPGGSAELGQGHVRNWRRMTARLLEPSATPEGRLVSRLWSALPPEAQREFVQAARSNTFDATATAQMTRDMNRALRAADLYAPQVTKELSVSREAQMLIHRRRTSGLNDRERLLLNRWLLVAALPDLVVPPPPGSGALLEGGYADPFAVDTLLEGRSKYNRLSLGALPWSAWWPTIWLWGGTAMALAFAVTCLTFIVHPQWSRRELLLYPVARFIEDITEREDNSWRPKVAKGKIFWTAMGLVSALHLYRGLNAWFPQLPDIPLWLNFYPLWSLFPNATRVEGAWGYFGPTLYLSVIAFSFFMPTSISFSLGVSQLLYLALGAALVANGFPGLSYSVLESKNSNLMRFGAYLGSAVIIAYTGRHYYKNVIVSAFGRRRPQEIPLYATWAARGLGLSLLVAVVILHGSGLNWLLSALFVLLTMLLYLVMTRIAAETGTFFIQPWWAPAGIITALLGFEALGPTAFVMLGIASVILVVDPREALMPFIANGLKVVETAGGISPPKVAPWIAVVLVGGFVVSGAVTLFLQYNYGVSLSGNTWATEFIPTLAIDPLVRFLSSSAADGTLTSATSAGFWERVRAIHPIPGAIPWFSFGLALVIGASVARLRLPKWPLHPVAFLVWGTYPMVNFAPAFLLGSGIKAAVVSASGTKGYQAVRPLMVGVIAGELTTGLFWMLVGAAYFFITGKPPQSYVIFPG